MVSRPLLVGWLVGGGYSLRSTLLYSTGWLGSRQDGGSDSMDGLVGALWCGGNLCVLAVGAAGKSDRREWWWLLLFRFAGHRVLISSDLCAGGWLARGRTLWVWRTEPQGKA